MPQRIRDKNICIFTHSGVNPEHFNLELLGLAYCIVMQYSNIESTELNVYVNILGGADSDSAKIFLDQTTLGHKTKTINTISQLKLHPQALDRLRNLRKRTDTVRKFRDKLAHWQPYQASMDKDKLPPPSTTLDLFNPPESHKRAEAISGYYRFSEAELKRTLTEANKLGRMWIDYEIELIKRPQGMLKQSV